MGWACEYIWGACCAQGCIIGAPIGPAIGPTVPHALQGDGQAGAQGGAHGGAQVAATGAAYIGAQGAGGQQTGAGRLNQLQGQQGQSRAVVPQQPLVA